MFSCAFETHALETHALETGLWAPDGGGNNLPATVQPYLEKTAWYQPAPNGGNWDWEYNHLGVVAGIALIEDNDLSAVFEKVDALLDDGNLSTGDFIKVGGRYLLILERYSPSLHRRSNGWCVLVLGGG